MVSIDASCCLNKFKPNWNEIRRRKQELIDANNDKQNAKRRKYTYRRGDKVLYLRRDGRKHHRHYDGPYKILKVYTNGTVQVDKGHSTERLNIRLLHPYHD